MFLKHIFLFCISIILITIGDDFVPHKYCTSLGNSVYCSNTKLQNIPEGISKDADKIYLVGNKISTFSLDSLERFASLKHLSLLRNQLQAFPSINILCNVSNLNLGSNIISKIKRNTFILLPKLQELNLTDNQFSRINNETLRYASKLKNLYISHNQIKVIDSRSFSDLSKLRKLYLNNNLLMSLPKELFYGLSSLKRLKLTKNRLTSLTDGVFHTLPSLSYLSLRRNRIAHLEDGVFHRLNSLESLLLDKNNITLSKFQRFFGLNSLTILSLKDNRIRSISSSTWRSLTSLKQLHLSNNELTYLGEDSFAPRLLSSLETLSLEHNHIQLVHPACFSSLRNLRILDLHDNLFQWPRFTGPFFPRTLTDLDLSGNAIRSLPSAALRLCNLTTLRLLDSRVASFFALPSLRSLKQLTVDTSSVICDCKLAAFISFIDGFKPAKKRDKIHLICAFPSTLRNKPILKVKHRLACHNLTLPTIVEAPTNQKVLLGGSTSLRCFAISPLHTTVIRWRRNHTILSSNASVTKKSMTSEGHTKVESVLTIRAIDGDQNSYSCQVENEIAITLSNTVNVTVLEMPSIVKRPIEKVNIRIGSTFQVECEANGSPAPKISWSKDEGRGTFPAASEKRMLFSPHDSRFSIVNVSRADIGVYRCSASNDAGLVYADVTLRVLALPIFTYQMSEFTEVTLNVTTLLTCPPANQPLTPVWLFNGFPMFNQSRRYLILEKLQESQIGEYTCELRNSLGTAKTTTTLRLSIISPLCFIVIFVTILVICILGISLTWGLIVCYIRRIRLSKRVSSSNISLYDKESIYTKVSRSENDYIKTDIGTTLTRAERHDSGLYEEESSIDQSEAASLPPQQQQQHTSSEDITSIS